MLIHNFRYECEEIKDQLLTIAQYGINKAPLLAASTGRTAFPLSFSRVGRADTSGTDKMIPLPVPTHKRSSVKRRAVIRTNEKPNLLVPERKIKRKLNDERSVITVNN